MKIKIVADSSANLFSLAGIDFASVPLKVNCNGKEYVDVPSLDLAGMVYDLKHTKSRSGTSCPNVQEWLDAFGDAEWIFAFTITSNLSGSYAAAVQAKEDYLAEHPQAKVCVVDSLTAGAEIAMLAEKARDCLLAGSSFEETEAAVREYATHTRTLFSLESMTNLANNGRVSAAAAKLAGILGIRAIGKASDVGTLEMLCKCRGEDKALATMFEEMLKNGFCGGCLRISHCMNPKAADQLKKLALDRFPQTRVIVEPCGALCIFYAEQGGLIIGYDDIAG